MCLCVTHICTEQWEKLLLLEVKCFQNKRVNIRLQYYECGTGVGFMFGHTVVGEGFYSTLKLTFTFFLANLEPF